MLQDKATVHWKVGMNDRGEVGAGEGEGPSEVWEGCSVVREMAGCARCQNVERSACG